VTLILAVATLAVLSLMGVACYRAQAEAAERLCDCLNQRVDEPDTSPTPIRRERHLRVVGAG
jgi:hypothetical protein